MIHNFGPFRLDVEAEILFRGTEPVPVGRRAVAVLRALVERRGAPVSKDALIEAAWSGLAVEESNLPVQIAALRKVLGAEPGGERWIETLPRRGYRFIGPITTPVQNNESADRHTPGAQAAESVQAVAVSIQTQPEPERRQLSIMSSELICSGLDLEELHEAVRAYQYSANEIARSFYGFLAKHVGNSVLLYFGFPTAHEDDVECAIRAGLALCASVQSLKATGNILLRCRIGISTGTVIIGNLGHETPDGSIAGEALDIAVRLQMSAQPSSVIIDGATRRLVGTLFDCSDAGEIETGGGKRIPVWQVLRTSAVESRFEALHGTTLTSFIGRDEELGLVSRRWAEVKREQGRVVLVTGEPGIGKSRFMRTVQEKLHTEPHIPLIFHCSPYHQDSALQPIIGQLSRSAGIERDDPSDAKLEKLAALLSELGGAAEMDMALFAALMSIPTGDRFPLPRETPRKLKERTLSALFALLARLCGGQPVLMIFEDLHWIDPTSLDLLTRIVEQADGMRILLLASARPEFVAPWPNFRHVTNVALSRLDRAEGLALIAGLTRGKALPHGVIDQIVARTDGVPLFIEELTKTVLESGLMHEAAQQYELSGPLPPMAIPSSLQASLLARLDRLGPAKTVAQLGAAIGREFSYSLIEAVAELPAAGLQAALSTLVKAELIFQRALPPDSIYVFKHSLVQNAAYASLIRNRCIPLHAKIVSALTAKRKAGEDVKLDMLGYHCSKAGMITDASEYYQRAAEQSIARSDLSEAIELLDKALAELSRLPHSAQRDSTELEVQCAKGTALLAFKGYAAREVSDTYTRAKTLWNQLGRPSNFFHVGWGLWLFHVNRGEIREAQELSDDLEADGIMHADASELIIGNLAKGGIALLQGNPMLTQARVNEVIKLYNATHHSELIKHIGMYPNLLALSWAGLILAWLGYPEQALARCREATTLACSTGHLPTLAICLAMSCRTGCLLAADTDLSKWLSALSDLAKDYELPFWTSQVPIYEGYLLLRQGNASEATKSIQRGLEDYSKSGGRVWRTLFLGLLSSALAHDNQLKLALDVLNEARQIGEASGEVWYSAEICRQRGVLLLRGTDPDTVGAEKEFEKAIDISRRQSTKWWELRAAISLANILHNQDRRIEARSLLAPLYGWFTEGLATAELREAKALLDELGM